jgi:dTDP-L-rhamnose 4-epimerase
LPQAWIGELAGGYEMSAGRVLITGGLGFIGLELTRQLSSLGYSVRIFDNLSPQIHGAVPVLADKVPVSPNIAVIRGDVVLREDFEKAIDDVDQIVHLAAETGTGQSMYEIARYDRVNSYGTALLLDILANRPHRVKKVVLSSSRAIYGEGQYRCEIHGIVQPAPRPVLRLKAGQWDVLCPECGTVVTPVATREAAVPQPASIYAATKLAQEEMVRIACTSLGIPYVSLRFQNVYGPGQSLNNPYTGILSIFSTRIRKGEPLPIFEDGMPSRDFVHVADVARAVVAGLESGRAAGVTFNVGSGTPTSIREVAEMLVRAFQGRSRVEITGQFRLGDIRHCYADMTAIREATGFEPTVDLEQGLRDFATWVARQPLPEDGLARANRELKERGLMS